jgi:asparagine synthase (glutamine-hydrolysing)
LCGIAGILNVDGSSVLPDKVFEMLLSIRHRGPDDEGAVLLDTSTGAFELRGGPDTPKDLNLVDLRSPTAIKADLALGNRRLSIIDLSPKGHQPQTNEDNTVWVVFNGEVYNYRELRKELVNLGHRFAGDSDTEVIIHGYEQWGMEQLLSKMMGMWGFALWDQKENRLFLVRDRFGIKPLYYHHGKDQLVFASEIKAIRRVYHAEVNEGRVAEFLWFKPYNASETFFRGINQVNASHYIEVDRSGAMNEKRYWDLFEINRGYGETGLKEATKTFYDHFDRSIRLHMRSDVPVGTCLSGGLDSSSIVCLSQKLLNEGELQEKGLSEIKKIKTFSSAPLEDRVSETPYIEEVVKYAGVEPFFVSPTFDEFFTDFQKVVAFHDEPFQGPSIYMQYRVIKLAKEKGVKVLLDGQGGDECLAGYQRYLLDYLNDLRRQGHYAKALRELFRTFDLSSPYAAKYIRRKLGLSKKRFGGVIKVKEPENRPLEYPVTTLADRLRYDLLAGSIIELLKYEDTNSMVFSIESRVPFLYHPMIEYLFTLPMSLKIHNGWTKYLLRNSMSGILPEKVRLRRSKLGFPAPEEEWARELISQKMEWCRALAKNSEVYLNPGAFEGLCAAIKKNGRAEDFQLFWRILIFSSWLGSLKAAQ